MLCELLLYSLSSNGSKSFCLVLWQLRQTLLQLLEKGSLSQDLRYQGAQYVNELYLFCQLKALCRRFATLDYLRLTLKAMNLQKATK